MNLEKIVIIGAGNGGQAAAVDLTNRGFKVCLYEFPEFFAKLTNKYVTRTITSTGFVDGNVTIDQITKDKKEAAEYSKIVLVTMPAFGHSKFFGTFKDELQEGTQIYFFPGNLASLNAPKTLFEQNITLVEFSSLPYGCRVKENGTVKISIQTSLLTYAAFPAKNTTQVQDTVKQLYPRTRASSDILEVSLNNPNPLIHPPGVLFNIGRIEHSKGQFYMYNEGMTESIIRVIDAVNKERHKIGAELAYNLIDKDEFKGVLLDGTEKLFIDCGKDARMLGPCSKNNRYLTEDVPYGLVYWSELSKKIGVATPNIDSIITMTSTICGLRFDEQKTVVQKSLPHNKEDIKNFLRTGY